ncbi:MAG: hypothetical protein E6G49_09895 [Actinobacteria bacterium]|nr:MAG: hypothetical protein E6G49_09895 [Actinomycetota bacterium]
MGADDARRPGDLATDVRGNGPQADRRGHAQRLTAARGRPPWRCEDPRRVSDRDRCVRRGGGPCRHRPAHAPRGAHAPRPRPAGAGRALVARPPRPAPSWPGSRARPPADGSHVPRPGASLAAAAS